MAAIILRVGRESQLLLARQKIRFTRTKKTTMEDRTITQQRMDFLGSSVMRREVFRFRAPLTSSVVSSEGWTSPEQHVISYFRNNAEFLRSTTNNNKPQRLLTFLLFVGNAAFAFLVFLFHHHDSPESTSCFSCVGNDFLYDSRVDVSLFLDGILQASRLYWLIIIVVPSSDDPRSSIHNNNNNSIVC